MRIRRWLRWRSEAELNEEIQAHLDMETDANIERGLAPDEALAAAKRRFGNAVLVRERAYEANPLFHLESLFKDVRYALRNLARSTTFTAVAVLSLGIGIGANCAIFSMADLLLLRPLPVPQPDRIVTVGSSMQGEAFHLLRASYPDYMDLRDRTESFAGVVAYCQSRVRFARTPRATPDMKMGMTVSGNFFDVLGVEPELGRGFRPEEDEAPGRDAVLMLSHRFWEQEFGADPNVLGRQVRINDIAFTVIGVVPERFTSIDQWVQPLFYMPAMMQPRLYPNPANPDPAGHLAKRDVRFLNVKARLKPGVSVGQARAEVGSLGAALAASYPATNRDSAMMVQTELEAREEFTPYAGTLVAMLMVLAGAVLLVACANVASLLTSRAPARAREMALRLAIGAGRMRLVRQLFTESVLLAGAGGLLGIGVGYAGVALLDRFAYVSDVPVVLSLRMDERTLLFGLGAAVVSVFLFGLVPAFRTARADLAGDLKHSGGRFSQPRLWGRNILVAGQVAVALVLLALSSFMYLGFRQQLLRGPGYRTDHLLTMEFDPSLVNYTAAETEVFYQDLTDRARELPAVRSATLASFIPLTSEWESRQIVPEGYEFPEGIDSFGVVMSRVDEQYFDTLAVPIVEGRGFLVTDDVEAPRVAVVNQTLAEEYWPGQSAVGRRFRLDGGDGPWVRIVGVARDAKYTALTEAPTRFLYLPYAQNLGANMILMVQSAGDPAQLAAPLRELVRDIDPEQPTFEVRTMEAFFQGGPVKNTLVVIQSVAAMGLMAIALALTGLYGLVTYAVNTRTHEIGIRMAIGADRGAILRMVLRQGLVLALSGVIVGVVLSALAARLLGSVFPVGSPNGGLVGYGVVVPAVLAVTALAAYIPAARASRIDPVKVLGYE